MILDIMNIAALNAIILSILMAIFFISKKKGPRTSNLILAGLLISFVLVIISVLPGALWRYAWLTWPSLYTIRFSFLIPPLFYLYIKSILQPKFRLTLKDSVHIVPFVIALAFAFLERHNVHNWMGWVLILKRVGAPIVIFQNILYLYLSIRLVKLHGYTIRTFLKNVSNSKYTWLQFFVIGYIMFWLILFNNMLLLSTFKIPHYCPFGGILLCLVPFTFFNFITLFALIRPDVFSRPFGNGNTLSDSYIHHQQNRLLALMENDKIFLDPSLTLNQLAQQMSIPTNYLSRIINETFHLNFNDFINKYRIEESKTLLANRENGQRNILQIAYEVGFHSKTTFNSAFKKFTGTTPSEYKKQS